jgi:hypothetical protein
MDDWIVDGDTRLLQKCANVAPSRARATDIQEINSQGDLLLRMTVAGLHVSPRSAEGLQRKMDSMTKVIGDEP